MDEWLTLRQGVHALVGGALVFAIIKKAWSLYVVGGVDTAVLRRAARRGKIAPGEALRSLWGVDAEDGLDVAIEDALERDASSLALITGLTKLLFVSGLAFGMYELIWIAVGDHGLLALQAGYVQQIAIGRIGVHAAITLGGLTVGRWASSRFENVRKSRAQILKEWQREQPSGPQRRKRKLRI